MVGHETESSEPLPSTARGVDHAEPGRRTDTEKPWTAIQTLVIGQDTAVSPEVGPLVHGASDTDHDVPSKSSTEAPTMAVHHDGPVHDTPTRPDWNRATVEVPTRVVKAWRADHDRPWRVATCPVLST